jgi:hypothetical protein
MLPELIPAAVIPDDDGREAFTMLRKRTPSAAQSLTEQRRPRKDEPKKRLRIEVLEGRLAPVQPSGF